MTMIRDPKKDEVKNNRIHLVFYCEKCGKKVKKTTIYDTIYSKEETILR